MKQIKITADGFYNKVGEKKAVLLHNGDILNVVDFREGVGLYLAETTVANDFWGIPVGTGAWVEVENCEVV